MLPELNVYCKHNLNFDLFLLQECLAGVKRKSYVATCICLQK